MTRLVDADALPRFGRRGGLIHAEDVDRAPTVEAVPVVHGRWIRDEFGTKCGACGLYAYRDKFDQPWESPYCPNCGSRNRSEE